jgi:hypothetical protein
MSSTIDRRNASERPMVLSAAIVRSAAVSQEGPRLNPLKQSPPPPARLTPRQRLDLAPIPALTGAVGRQSPLAHHAFQPVPFGHLEERLAVFEGFRG